MVSRSRKAEMKSQVDAVHRHRAKGSQFNRITSKNPHDEAVLRGLEKMPKKQQDRAAKMLGKHLKKRIKKRENRTKEGRMKRISI